MGSIESAWTVRPTFNVSQLLLGLCLCNGDPEGGSLAVRGLVFQLSNLTALAQRFCGFGAENGAWFAQEQLDTEKDMLHFWVDKAP